MRRRTALNPTLRFLSQKGYLEEHPFHNLVGLKQGEATSPTRQKHKTGILQNGDFPIIRITTCIVLFVHVY